MSSRTRIIFLVVLAAVALSVTACQSPAPPAASAPAAPQAQTVTCAQSRSSSAPFPPPPTAIDATCAVIPLDFQGQEEQANFDLESWLTFVALNWPAAPGCVANPDANIMTAPPNPVWLSWLQDSDVFVPAGQSPQQWCFGISPGVAAQQQAQRTARLAKLPPGVRALAEKHPDVQMFLHHSAKASRRSTGLQAAAAANPHIQEVLQSTGDVLVDQNGRWARFTVSVNQTEYKDILAQTLWTIAGQKAATNITFTPSNTATGETGAMEIKAAWKVLGANDDPSSFFTMQAIVYNDVSGDPSPGPQPVTIGLAGFHISHKTALQKTWIWSTFEQVDNDTKSFYNPKCPPAQCPPNTKTVPNPTTAQELNAQGQPNFKPAQVVAVTPSSAGKINQTFSTLLKGTPWANYRLISTQWIGELGNTPKPPSLGNSVQETFVPNGSMYGCLNCHKGAIARGNQPSDLSWLPYFAVQQ
jgi:hypothetical protein